MCSAKFVVSLILVGLFLGGVTYSFFRDKSYKAWRVALNIDGTPHGIHKHDEYLLDSVEEYHKYETVKSWLPATDVFDKLSDHDWELYKDEFDRSFKTFEDERQHLRAFISAEKEIRDHNEAYRRGQESFKVEVNEFAGYLSSEYENFYGFKDERFRFHVTPALSANCRRSKSISCSTSPKDFTLPKITKIPDAIDWRKKGYVTEIKDQQRCGSCWAFSAIGALEGQYKNKTGILISLSEQLLVDCEKNGCEGGLMTRAFQYVITNGIKTEQIYPYYAKRNTCPVIDNDGKIPEKVVKFVELPKGDENVLKIIVATVGPVSVAIDAKDKDFMLYKEGVYYNRDCSTERLGHGVLVVGYGTDPKHGDYWIVKNSWGAEWGNDGYIHMARNKKNHCGIASLASYPVFA